MRRFTMRIAALCILLPGLLAACNFSASTANISEAQLTRDEEGSQPTNEFDPQDTVYAHVSLANAPDDTSLAAVWTAVDIGAAGEPNQLIDEVELQAGSGNHFFSLAPTSPFPPGSYKVELSLNGEPAQTLEFSVAGEVAAAPDEPAAETPAEEPTDTPAGGAVSTLEGVAEATIRITTEGSFQHPEFGSQLNAAGQGSGFIIDPSGVAVTNNHVVTGAAFLEVWLDGEESPRNARILGVSECSDLAVIDIDGDGFPYLDWHEGDIQVGMDIYAAGYPQFGNTEYTLTRGVVSKAAAGGETPWASVDSVLEIDARILGGNSGGPLVTADGQVVGVNYAGRDDTQQAYSISRDEALPVIEQLRQGNDMHAIGINGEAIISEDGQLYGVWVSSVESGTPADQVGLKSGDIITMLEGLVLGTDGTLSDYCDILRSRNPNDVMSVEVLRFETGEILAGQLNGDLLQVTQTIDLGEEVATGETYASYVSITDDTGALQVDVPEVWTELDGGGWVENGEVLGPGLLTAPIIEDYLNFWDAPGMFFGARSDADRPADPAALIDAYDLSDGCTYDGRVDYEDALYTGVYDVWADCGGVGSFFIVLGAEPDDGSTIILIQMQIASSADEEALNRVLETFVVTQ